MAEAFDMSLVQRGARNRRTPYYDATQQYGPKGYTVYNHMYFPIRFDSFENEFDALLNAVTLWDVSVERCLEISGPDGFTFAQLMTPRDLSKCAVGQAKYVLICDGDGGIINDPVLTRMDENTFWFALASSDALLFARGLKNAYPDLDVTIQEADVAPLQVQGPKSRELVSDLFGAQVEKLGYYHFFEAKLEGIPVIVTRTGWTGELGYELYLLDPKRGVDLWNRVMEAGKRYNIAPTGPSDIRRIEAGILNYGIDMTLENNPYELGLERLVNPDKAADFIGRDALRRISKDGVKQKLVGVEISGTKMDLNFTRYPIRGGGFITSCVHSPRLKKNIGYAMLPVDRTKDKRLEIDAPDAVRTAQIVPMPFIDPRKEIAKS